jgi:hypothetical protein
MFLNLGSSSSDASTALPSIANAAAMPFTFALACRASFLRWVDPRASCTQKTKDHIGPVESPPTAKALLRPWNIAY